MRLRTLVILTNTDGTLAADTVGPEATKLNLSLGHALVGEEQPSTEDRLGDQIKDTVEDSLRVGRDDVGTFRDSPTDGVA